MLKQSRSLDRGLMVLQTLARHGTMSLSDIHRDTSLPKSTLRRLLATMVSRRFVRRSITDKLYRITITLPDITINPVPPGLAVVTDIGMQHLLDLTDKIGWPSDLQILDRHWMQVVESTRSVSPFGIYRVNIDLRINLFGSATGTACLSQMEETQVRALFEDNTIGPMLNPSRFNLTWDQLQTHLAKIRAQGYGERLPNFKGEIVANDRLFAIALPFRNEGELCGAVSLLWPRAYLQPDEFARLHLQDLRDTVAQMESVLNRTEH